MDDHHRVRCWSNSKIYYARWQRADRLILTAILGIVGAFVATYLGQALGWYGPGERAGLIGAVVGAVIVLLVYGLTFGRRRAI
jgi:uncharacterized membrane protein YeaQ/YmgE (transglycosylase-associated protein family)